MINFFTFKDKIPVFLRSGIVYKFKCGGCNATYYGKTKRHLKIRTCEHLGVSALTRKRVKGYNDSAIKEHHLFCNYSSGFDDFSMLASNRMSLFTQCHNLDNIVLPLVSLVERLKTGVK